MLEITLPKIEIEFRSIFDKGKFNSLKQFLDKNAKDLGEDDKDVHFFIMPNKLLKVVNNVSKNSSEIVIKLNKIGAGSDFEEIEIPISKDDTEKAIKIFSALNITDNIMRSFQKRHNYSYKGVELALKFSDAWGYHLEIEIVISDKGEKTEAENLIISVANELGVKLMSDLELATFTSAAEKNYKNSSE